MDFHDRLIDLLVIGPACPMPLGCAQPYAVHRKGRTHTVWIADGMTPEQQVALLAEIEETYGLPCEEILRERHPSQIRAEQLIRAQAPLR